MIGETDSSDKLSMGEKSKNTRIRTGEVKMWRRGWEKGTRKKKEGER